MSKENCSNYKYVHVSEDAVIIITALSEEQASEILKNTAVSPNRWRLDEVDELIREV